MPQKKQKKAKGLPKRASTNKGRCSRYYAGDRHAENTLRRILKSSGPMAASQWAKGHQALSVLNMLSREMLTPDQKTAVGQLATIALQKS